MWRVSTLYKSFQWFVDNDPGSPGDLVLYRTREMSRNAGIKAGGTLVVLNEQDVPGEYCILIF